MPSQPRGQMSKQTLAPILLLLLAAIIGSTLGRFWPIDFLCAALVALALVFMLRFYRRSRDT